MADVQKWNLKGQWFDVCRCAIPCPCSWAQPPDDGFCEGILIWHIRQGHDGKVKLDGLWRRRHVGSRNGGSRGRVRFQVGPRRQVQQAHRF